MNTQDDAIEELHQDIARLRAALDALETIIDLCDMDAHGIWSCPTIAGGRVLVSKELNTALHRAIKAWASAEYHITPPMGL